MGVGGIFVTLRAITSKFRSDFSKAQASVNRFRTSMVNVNRQLKRVGKQMSKVGKQMSASLTLPIVAAGALAVKTFAEFEQEMAKVKAVSGATGEEFKKLENLAKSLGETTRFTAAEVATLQLNYSKLGFVPAQIEKITKPTLDLALATGEDLAQSAEVAGGTLRAFALTADQMPRLVDVMAKSFSSSALNLEKFRDSMKSVAPVANAVGANLEDTTAILSTLVDSNIDASTAGTSLRNIFLELAAKGLTWNQAMSKIKNSTNKASTANKLFGKRAVAAALVIADNTEKIEELSGEYKNAGGSAEKMANIMDDTLQGSLLKVKSALEGAAIELGKTLAPVIQKAGKFIAELAQQFSALSPETKKTIAIIAGVTAVIGPLLVVMGVMASTVIPALISGFALLLSPITLVIAALAAIGFAAFSVFNHFNRVVDAQDQLNDSMETARNAVAGEVGEINKLIKIAKSENLTREKRQAAIDELQEKYPGYLNNLTLEGINSEEAAGKIEKLKTSILRLATARAIEAQIQANEAKKLELSTQELGENLDFVDKATAGVKLYVGALSREELAQDLVATATKNRNEQLDGLTKANDLLIEKLGDLEKQQDITNLGTKSAADLARDAAEAELKRAKAALSFQGPTGITGEALVPTKAKAAEGKELIPLIIQLGRAREEAELFSKAFTEDNTQSLQRQRDALGDFISKSIQADDAITSATQTQIDLYDELGRKIEESGEKQSMLAEQARIVKDTVSNLFTSLGEGLGEALVSGDPAQGFKAFIQDLLGVVKAFGSTLIAIGTGLTASVFGIVEGPKTIAAGIALIAAATAGMALFAGGGLVFGETLGIVGEGRGTSRTNPEVIAPLDKLQSMLGGRDGGKQVIELKLRGETLRAVINKTSENTSFLVRE